MKSFTELENMIRDALLSVTDNVGKFEANDGNKTHVVFQIENEPNSFHADNKKLQRSINGSIDLYALHKDVGMADMIEKALVERQITFYLNTVLSGDGQKRQFIHYEWIFEVT